MKNIANGEAPGLGRALAAAMVLVALPAVLGGCSGNGLFADNRPDDISPDYFKAPAYCPIVQIRAGTHSYSVYERGHEGDPAFVRYQGTITKTARECRKTADGFAVKVGIAGRVVSGPKGGQGSVTVPIRVALMQETSGVKFSELYNVSVTMVPPTFNGSFSQVVDWIPVTATPQDRDFVIYVGFDEGSTS